MYEDHYLYMEAQGWPMVDRVRFRSLLKRAASTAIIPVSARYSPRDWITSRAASVFEWVEGRPIP